MSNNITISYAAGYLEADGYVMIGRCSRHDVTFGSNFFPRVGVVGAYPEPLQLFADCFGGRVRLCKRTKPDPRGLKHREEMYQWCVSGAKAVDIVRTLLPHMKIPRKIKRAKLVLAFKDKAKWWPARRGRPDQRMPRTEHTRRERLYEKCKAL